jgi:hypothetical protein
MIIRSSALLNFEDYRKFLSVLSGDWEDTRLSVRVHGSRNSNACKHSLLQQELKQLSKTASTTTLLLRKRRVTGFAL